MHKINKLFPKASVVGYHSGYFTMDEEKNIINDINKTGAELLIIGMGVPRQELWSYKNMEKFNNIKLLICGGAIIDFLADK